MQNEYFEQLQKVGQTSFNALQEIATINSNALQKLTELQLNFATQSIGSGIEQVKAVSSTSNYKDLFKFASEYTSDYSSKLVDVTRQTTEVLSSTQNDVITVIEKGITAPVKAAKVTTKRVSKKDID
jgi:phasin family protein